MAKEAIKIVLGGAVGIILAMLILRFGFGEDPFAVFGLAADDLAADDLAADDLAADDSPSTTADDRREKEIVNKPVDDRPSGKPHQDEDESQADDDDDADTDANTKSDDTQKTIPDEDVDSEPPSDSETLRLGLMRFEFRRLVGQEGNNGFVQAKELGDIVGNAKVLYDLHNWKFGQGRNAVMVGFLRIEEPGTHVFRTYNFYDRNALYVNGILISGYRGSQTRGTDSGDVSKNKERIHLKKGLVPIVSVGYVDSRQSVDVKWARPGMDNYERIGSSILSHEPSWSQATNAQELWDLVHTSTKR